MDYTVSYAPDHQDAVLVAIFGDKKKGFFVDLAATHPYKDSTTQALYKSGWHGVDVVTSQEAYDLFAFDRQRDTVILAPARFGDIAKSQHVDVLFVGEGQAQVLAANDWRRNRPSIVCIAAGQNTRLLEDNGYSKIHALPHTVFFAAKEFGAPKLTVPSNVPDWRTRLKALDKEQERTIKKAQADFAASAAAPPRQNPPGKQAGLGHRLRAAAKQLQGTIASNATTKQYVRPQFIPHGQDVGDILANTKGLQQLVDSYKNNLAFRPAGPSGAKRVVAKAAWVGLRAARKVVKRGLKRGNAS